MERVSLISLDNFKQFVPSDVLPVAELENYIFTVTEEKVEDSGKYTKNVPDKTVLRLIEHVATSIRPFNFKPLGDIYQKVLPYREKIHSHTRFIHYLFSRGVLTRDNFTRTFQRNQNSANYELVFPAESCWFYTKDDSLDGLINESVTLDVTKQKNRLLNEQITLLDLSAFCGSFKSFIYLMLNGCKVTSTTLDFSIRGGNEKIIELLEQRGYSYNNRLHAAIKFHQNRIVEWLYTNFNCDQITLPYCISNWNLECFFYLLNHGHNINEVDSAGKNVFDRASDNDNYILNHILLKLNLRFHKQRTIRTG